MNSKYQTYSNLLLQGSFEIPDKVKQKLFFLKNCVETSDQVNLAVDLEKDYPALDPDEVQTLYELNKSVQISMFCSIMQSVENEATDQIINGELHVKGETLGLWKQKTIQLNLTNKTLLVPRSDTAATVIMNLVLYSLTWLGEKRSGLKLYHSFQLDATDQNSFNHYKQLVLGSDNEKYAKEWYNYFKKAYEGIIKKRRKSFEGAKITNNEQFQKRSSTFIESTSERKKLEGILKQNVIKEENENEGELWISDLKKSDDIRDQIFTNKKNSDNKQLQSTIQEVEEEKKEAKKEKNEELKNEFKSPKGNELKVSDEKKEVELNLNKEKLKLSQEMISSPPSNQQNQEINLQLQEELKQKEEQAMISVITQQQPLKQKEEQAMISVATQQQIQPMLPLQQQPTPGTSTKTLIQNQQDLQQQQIPQPQPEPKHLLQLRRKSAELPQIQSKNFQSLDLSDQKQSQEQLKQNNEQMKVQKINSPPSKESEIKIEEKQIPKNDFQLDQIIQQSDEEIKFQTESKLNLQGDDEVNKKIITLIDNQRNFLICS